MHDNRSNNLGAFRMRARSLHLHQHPLTLVLMKLIMGGVVLLAVMLPAAATMAQELRIADETPITITDPEHSTAYYGKLQGEPEMYVIKAGEPFTLFLTILVPRTAGVETNVSAEVVDMRNPAAPLAILDGAAIEWQNFTERSGGDEYLAGPAFRATVPEGEYEVRISKPGNEGPYVLIIGDERGFSFAEVLRTYDVLPRIKSEFFDQPAYSAFMTPLLLWPMVIFLLVLGIAALAFWVWRRNRTVR